MASDPRHAAYVSDEGSTDIISAVRSADAGRLAALLQEEGADVDATDAAGRTALMFAAQHDDIRLTQLLIDAGADASKTANDGFNALHQVVVGVGVGASVEAAVIKVEMLVAAGVDVRQKDGDGNTAADVARSEGHTAIAELLATPK